MSPAPQPPPLHAAHEYSFSDGILTFAPHGPVLPEHAAQLVSLFRQHARPAQPLPCLFDMTGAPAPTPAARRVIVDYFRCEKPQIVIATHGAPLHVRAMLALVGAAARVVGGYALQVSHFDTRESACQYLRTLPSA